MGGVPARESPPALIPKNRRVGFARRLLAGPAELRARLIAIYSVLAVLNVGAWVCALIVFRGTPVSLALMLMIYGLGLRHAVDADHIAAIDNVTRKFMEEHRRPVAVGFFFALGHSAVVLVVTEESRNVNVAEFRKKGLCGSCGPFFLIELFAFKYGAPVGPLPGPRIPCEG